MTLFFKDKKQAKSGDVAEADDLELVLYAGQSKNNDANVSTINISIVLDQPEGDLELILDEMNDKGHNLEDILGLIANER